MFDRVIELDYISHGEYETIFQKNYKTHKTLNPNHIHARFKEPVILDSGDQLAAVFEGHEHRIRSMYLPRGPCGKGEAQRRFQNRGDSYYESMFSDALTCDGLIVDTHRVRHVENPSGRRIGGNDTFRFLPVRDSLVLESMTVNFLKLGDYRFEPQISMEGHDRNACAGLKAIYDLSLL